MKRVVREFLYKPKHKKGEFIIEFVVFPSQIGCQCCKLLLSNKDVCKIANLCSLAIEEFSGGDKNVDVCPKIFYIG